MQKITKLHCICLNKNFTMYSKLCVRILHFTYNSKIKKKLQ